TSRALALAALALGWRNSAPIMALSSTDIDSKVSGTWKVRARPNRARASGGWRVTLWPAKATLPEVTGRSPVRQLKKVDLPAPLGPIRPRMAPCSSVIDAASTALQLPNAFVRTCASRSMGGSCRGGNVRRLAAPGRQPLDQGQDAAGLEARDQHDDGAVDDEGKTCAIAAEQIVGDFLQRHQDRGADQRAEQQPGTAERRHDEHFHRDQDAEPGVRIDEAEHGRIQRTGDAGQPGAEHEGVEFDAAGRRAQRARGAL